MLCQKEALGCHDVRAHSFFLFSLLALTLTPPVLGQERLDATVVRVVDGDTLEVIVEEREETVRLIGVDCPETRRGERLVRQSGEVNMAAEDLRSMSEEIARRVEEDLLHQAVVLEFDVDHRDRYSRLLAYLWRGDDLYNELLVARGWAMVYTVPPNVRYQERLMAAQQRAREGGMGFWKETTPLPESSEGGSPTGPPRMFVVLVVFVATAGLVMLVVCTTRAAHRQEREEEVVL